MIVCTLKNIQIKIVFTKANTFMQLLNYLKDIFNGTKC